MSKLLIPLALVLSLSPFAPAREEGAEREAVEEAVRDYVEALYLVQPERIERSVHKDLEKLGLWREEGSKEYSEPGKMTFEQLHQLAGAWNKDGRVGSDMAYDIEVLDVMDRTASAKLTAEWGIDYMHLVKSESGWQTVQILWQSHPPAN